MLEAQGVSASVIEETDMLDRELMAFYRIGERCA